MSKDVFVYIETKDNAARKVSFELLSLGREMASAFSSKLYAVLIGSGVEHIADSLRACADTILLVNDDIFKNFRCDTFASAFESLLNKYKPYLVIGGSTIMGKDLFPRLAARFQKPIISDATGMEFNESSVKVKKPIFGGKINSWIECRNTSTVFITFRPNSFSILEGSKDAEVVKENPVVAEDTRLKMLGAEIKPTIQIDLQESDFIICGGRGMKGPEQFGVLEEIAGLMGGRVGASRGAVDNKWRDYDDQIGKSGRTVSPKIYIGCGVSGALHHIMGMDTSKVIVAVNKDANAPIFQYADYGIVEDLFEVVPLLKEELNIVKEKAVDG